MLNNNDRILFQGDSITDCQRNREDYYGIGSGYPLLVKAELTYNRPEGGFECLNRGVSGNRIVDLYARWSEDCVNLNPGVISILIGVNDAWHELNSERGVSAQKFEKIYDMLLEETKTRLNAPRLVILEPFALKSESTEEKWMEWEAEMAVRQRIVAQLAEKHGGIFIPLQSLFDGACEKAPASYWLYDGVHPTPAGHMLIARAWMDAVLQSIVRASS